MKKLGIKLGALFLGAACLIGAAGCAPRVSDLTLDYDFTETGDVIEYTFYSTNWESFEGRENDRILKHLEDKFKIKINITGASSSVWKDRLATEIADGDTPDLFFTVPEESTFTDYIRKQVITDLNPYLDRAAETENTALAGVGKADSLKAILNSADYKETTTVNDKNYFVPQSVGYTTRVMLARKDWIKKWNESKGKTGDAVYDAPQTLSEFTDMLRFFREGDPDGNGRTDTYGLQLSNNWDYIQDMFATFGIQPAYTTDANGNFQISAMQDNYKDMLDWFTECCEKSYVYPEFSTRTDAEALQLFYQGGCGVVLSVSDFVLDGIIYELRRLYPDQDYKDLVMLITPPDSDDGQYKGAFKGWNFYWGGWCVSADAPEPMRLVRLLDYLFSPEGQKLMTYGIEGVHYTEENGTIVPNYAERLAEGELTFSCRDENFKDQPSGRYRIGYQLNSCPYILGEDNRLHINYPYDTAFDPDLMKQAYDLTYETTPNFSALRTIIADPDINDYNSLIQSSIETYTYRVIAGNSQETEYAELMKNLTAHHYEEVLDYLNANNKL